MLVYYLVLRGSVAWESGAGYPVRCLEGFYRWRGGGIVFLFLLRSKALMGVVAPGAIQGFFSSLLFIFYVLGIYLYIHGLGPLETRGP